MKSERAGPFPKNPLLHVPWVFLPKCPLPKGGFPGLATLEEVSVALTTDTKFISTFVSPKSLYLFLRNIIYDINKTTEKTYLA